MTLIVIEGVDGAGKSTLVQRLRTPDTEVLHKGPMKEDVFKEYVKPLLTYREATGPVIYDRWHVGELVYGPLYRGESKVTNGMRRYIEMLLDSRGALKVILDAPLAEIQRRLESRGEDFLQPQDLTKVHNFYRLYGSEHGWHVLEDPDPDVIDSQALMLENLTAFLRPYLSYVGSTRPDVLLVGQTISTPAFVPYQNSAAELLFDKLPESMRAGVCGLEPNILDLWQLLNGPKVIALGTKAQAHCIEHGVKIRRTIPHPHEILKYAPSRADEYGEAIAVGVRRG